MARTKSTATYNGITYQGTERKKNEEEKIEQRERIQVNDKSNTRSKSTVIHIQPYEPVQNAPQTDSTFKPLRRAAEDYRNENGYNGYKFDPSSLSMRQVVSVPDANASEILKLIDMVNNPSAQSPESSIPSSLLSSRRSERDDLINRYKNGRGMIGFNARSAVDAAGGINALLREQQIDAANDRKYRAKLNGIDVDNMPFLERLGGTLGNIASGTEKGWAANKISGILAGAHADTIVNSLNDAGRKAALEYVKEESVNVPGHSGISHGGGGEYIDGDYSLQPKSKIANLYGKDADAVISLLDEAAKRLRSGDTSVTDDYILSLLKPYEGNLNPQYDTIRSLKKSSEEDLEYAKTVNPVEGIAGDFAVEAASSALSSAQDMLLSRIATGGLIKGIGAVGDASKAALVEAGASKFAQGATGFVFDRVQDIIGMSSFAQSSYGGAVYEAREVLLEQGYDIGREEQNKIRQYASANMWIELGSEMLFSSVGAIKNASGTSIFGGFSDTFGDAASRWAATPNGSRLLRILGEKIGGGVEEGLEEVIGDIVRGICNVGGIIGEDEVVTTENLVKDFSVGFISGLMGEATNAGYNYAYRNQIGNAVLNGEADMTYQQLYDIAAGMRDAQSEDASGMTYETKAMIDAINRIDNSGEGATSQNAGRLYQAYSEIEEAAARGELYVDNALNKARSGQALSKGDLNLVLQNDTARGIVESEIGQTIEGVGTREKRENLRAAIEGLARSQDESGQAQSVVSSVQEGIGEIRRRDAIERNPFSTDYGTRIMQRMQMENTALGQASVIDAATKLGIDQEGGETFASLYNGSQDALQYTGDMTRFYNQGLNDKAMDLSVIQKTSLTPAQAQAAYNAGRMEMTRREYGEEEVRVRDSGERIDSESTGRQAGRMAEGTGQAEIRQAGFYSFGSQKADARISAKSLTPEIIRGLGLQDVTNSTKQSVVAAKEFAESHGMKFVAWAGGALHVNGKQVRGFYDPSSNTVYVRDGAATFTAEQIARHEVTHGLIANGKLNIGDVDGREASVSYATIRDVIIKKLGSPDRFTKLVDNYVEAYKGSGLDRQGVWEEIVCDAMGGMNEFAAQGHFELSEFHKETMAAVREVAEANIGEGGEARGEGRVLGGDAKTSIDFDPKTHTETEKRIYEEYINSVDPRLKRFVEKYYNNPSNTDFSRQYISDVSKIQASMLKDLTGADYSDYTNNITSRNVRHIDKRHGNGENRHDSTMQYPEDVARLGFVLENPDDCEYVYDEKGRVKTTGAFSGSDGKAAPVIQFTRKVDGVYAVTLAVADNRYKKLWVLNTFMAKNRSAITRASNADVSALKQTSESEPTSLALSAKTVAEVKESVKPYLTETFPEYKSDAKSLDAAEKAVQQLVDNELKLSQVLGEKKNTSGIRTLGVGITRDLIHKGRVNLVGQKVNSAEDVARICQIFRNPMFETVRYLYVRKGHIVGMDAVSARLPGISPASIPGKFEAEDLLKKIDRVKADGYYILHNHPSGVVEPSGQDIALTKDIARITWEAKRNGEEMHIPMLGHVIIDHEVFSVLDSYGDFEEKELSGQRTLDMLLTPSLYFEGIGERANTPKKVADVAKAVTSESVSAIIYTDSKMRVRQIQEVANKVLLNNKQMASYIRNQRIRVGGGAAFVYTTDRSVFDAMERAYEVDILTDLMLDDVDGFYSAREGGQWRDPDKYMGKFEGEIFAESRYVSEENEGSPIGQQINSAGTSLNQVPALHKDARVQWGNTNIDIGAGAYEAATEYLKDKGVRNLKWDPYNQSEDVNRSTLKYLQSGNKADTATNANVLNVIREKDARLNVILQAAKSIKQDGKAYFMVYEGDGSGIGRETSKGWQNNLKTKEYADEIRTYFNDVKVKGKLIEASEPKANLPKASWEVKPGTAVKFSRVIDSEYSAALEAGDEAKMAELVKQSAEAAGYDMHLYHGAKKGGGFTVFRGWSYFTENKSYAERYTERENPDSLYEVYAKSDRMFDTRKDEDRDIFESFRQEYGMSEVTENGLPDWTDGYDIADFIEENDLDYDGIILNEGGDMVDGKPVSRGPSYMIRESEQVKSAAPVTYDNDGNVIPLSERFNDKNEDIRFSRVLGNDDLIRQNNELLKEYAALRRKYEARTEQRDYWRGQTKVTKERALKAEDLNHLAKSLIRTSDSEATPASVSQKLDAIARYLLNTKDDMDVAYGKSRMMAYEVAHEILDQAKVLNTKGGEDFYQDFRDVLRSVKIYVAPSVRDELAPDGWNDFRKSFFGTMTLTADKPSGLTIDKAYTDLQDRFGEWLFPADITGEAEQLSHIIEVLETYKPVYEGIDSYEMADAVEYKANEILDRILGEEMRETDPTYADRMEKRLKDQKEKYTEALRKVREHRDQKVANLKAHYQEVAENKRAKRLDSANRTRLLKIARRLNNMKLPRVTRALLNQYIGELDLVSKSIMGWKIQELETLNDWYEDWVARQKAELGEDYVPDSAIEKRLERLKKKRISDMTQEEVADLTTVLLGIEHAVRTEHQLIDSEERRDNYASALAFMYDYSSSRAHSDKSFAQWLLFGSAKKSIKYTGGDGLLSPERAVHRLVNYNDNDPLYKLTKELADGQRKMFDYERLAEKRFMKWTQDKKFVDSIAGKNAKLITVKALVDGKLKDVKITPAMRMSLYLHAKNEQNLKHLEKGGVLIPNMDSYKNGKMDNAYKYGIGTRAVLSRYMVHEISKGMSEQERAFADAAFDYFNSMSKDAINEVSNALKGYDIATVEKYFPISTSTDFLKTDFGMLQQDGSVAGQGFTHERVESTKPMMLYDMNEVLTRSIKGHSRYYGLAIPVRNLNLLLNVQKVGYAGEGSVRNLLLDEHIAYLDKMIRDVQNGAPGEGGLFSSMRSKYAGGVLSLNAGVALKQAASYPTAAAVIGYGPLLKALKNPTNRKVDLDLIAKYTPLLWYRSKGYSTAELGDIGNQGGVAAKMMSHKALNWIQGVDLWTTRKLWTAAEYYVQEQNKSLKYGTDAFYQEVAKVYNRIIEETQPNYAAMQRPGTLRSDSQWMRALNMFKTQPFQNANILIDAVGNYNAKRRQYTANRSAETQAALQEARKSMVRAITSQALSAFVFAMMQFAWDALRGKTKKYKDDDDEMNFLSASKAVFLNMVTSVGGMVPFGGTALEFLESTVDKIATTLGGDAIFDQKFYGLSENSLEAVNDLASAIQNLATDTIKGFQGTANAETTARNIVNDLSTVIHMTTGIPAPNVVKDMQVVALNAMRIYARSTADGYFSDEAKLMAEYAALRITTDPAKYKSDYYAILGKAFRKESPAYEELYDKMIAEEAFATDSTPAKGIIDNKVKEWGYDILKNAYQNDPASLETIRMKLINMHGDPFATDKKTAEEAINDKIKSWERDEIKGGKNESYNDSVKLLEASSIWSQATDKQQEEVLGMLYDIAIGNKTGQGYSETIKGGSQYGLDQTEYLLYRLALKMVDQPNKNGKLGGTPTNDEVEEAIRLLTGLSDAERAYLWNASGKNEKTNPWR